MAEAGFAHIVLGFAILLFITWPARGQTPFTPANKPEPGGSRMFIDPSSSAVSLGRAYLTVNPLVTDGKVYVGDYQLKVRPYFFMSETGKLELEASDKVMRLPLGEDPVAFTGTASNNKHGKPKIITGKMTPSAIDRGSVTFFVETDNGRMTFTTLYHFAE